MIVSNTGPLIALSRIGRLGLLPKIFGRVLIPGAVRDESFRPFRPGAQEMKAASWLHVEELSSVAQALAESLPLDRGEAESIALATTRGQQLLIDERRGRTYATRTGVVIVGPSVSCFCRKSAP